jgi:hypothetical protein
MRQPSGGEHWGSERLAENYSNLLVEECRVKPMLIEPCTGVLGHYLQMSLRDARRQGGLSLPGGVGILNK